MADVIVGGEACAGWQWCGRERKKSDCIKDELKDGPRQTPPAAPLRRGGVEKPRRSTHVRAVYNLVGEVGVAVGANGV